MKIDFTKDEKFDILSIIKEYEDISNEMDVLRKTSKEINERIDELTININNLSNREKILIGELKKKYGNFNLQDISDTLYG